MLEILGRKTSTNVQKVLWCCDELGIPFEREDIGGPFGRNRDPEYLALNPNGLVPTVIIDGFVLWESNTIIRYLGTIYDPGGLWPTGARQRAAMEKWMDWELTIASRAMVPVYLQLIRTPPDKRDPIRLEADRRDWTAAMTVLDGGLDGNDFTSGARFTLSDISLGPITYRWFNLNMERPPLRHLDAWYKRLTERPAYRQHVMIEMV